MIETYDWKIKKNNQVIEEEYNLEDNFYQYVICYPKNFYDIDPNIITPLENAIFYLTKITDAKIYQLIPVKKYSRIFIFIVEIISFYYLTVARIVLYNIILVILFLIIASIEFYYKIKGHEYTMYMQYSIL